MRLRTAYICLAVFSEDAYVADWRFNASLLVQRIDAGEGAKIPGGPISFGCWNFEQTDPVSVCLDGLLMSRLLPRSQPATLPPSLPVPRGRGAAAALFRASETCATLACSPP